MGDWLKSNTASAAILTGVAASTAAAYMWANSDPDGYRMDMSLLTLQGVEVPDIPACRSSAFLQGQTTINSDDNTIKTLYDVFLSGLSLAEHNPCLGWRSSITTGYDNWLTYAEVLERSTHIGCGMRMFGQKPKNDNFVGVFSRNRPEMAMVQLACYQQSMCVVPMYDTLGEEAVLHICNQTKMEMIIFDADSKLQCLLKKASELPFVKTVVNITAVSDELRKATEAADWTLVSYKEMESQGKNTKMELVLCQPDDLAVVCYTSGTTGTPKGAMITHRGLVASNLGAFYNVEKAYPGFLKNGEEVHFSYLPMAHMYEQVVLKINALLSAEMMQSLAYNYDTEVALFAIGGRIGFYSGDIKNLMGDLKALRPTIFPSVPRLLNRLYDKVHSNVNQSIVKSWLFKKGLDAKETYFKRGLITKSSIWDKLVFKKLQDSLGGRVKMIVTGSAPIAAHVMRFLRLAFGAVVLEGYGQTESSAVMTVTLPNDTCDAEVGPPIVSCMVKLVDVPEMECYAANNRGEVCCFGSNVFKGYLYDKEKTAEAIDEEGWLHTGDIGEWTERGTLKIVDRKKNIFKLAQGEYIAPEKIENIYTRSPLLAQCYIHGESLKASLVGVVVPDTEVFGDWVAHNLKIIGSLEELCRNQQVKKAVLENMLNEGKKAGLKGFEQVKDITLWHELFSVDNGLLTPTFKLKRIDSKKFFQEAIDAMYSNIE